ncbi:MAG: PIG-L family deacetylase [Saprospiraceae bacterium]|nr:PIG-L family deacetylase [Pyrinomonadaceae bacterium]
MKKLTRSDTKLFGYLFAVCLIALPWTAPGTQAQIRPVYDQGALGLGQLLKRLNSTSSVLMIGAHPDDEDTALLAYLARGESARTAYLSLTRGDGGQNIIGPELGEALGVIRTEELLQARKLDGAEQFFTRAYDYGFSKTLAEAQSKWDEKIILCDVVRVIRNFRPLVVISQFSGTPADGHGHHQFAGYISALAVKAAVDRAQCEDAGVVWQVKKFYVRHRGTGEPTLRINTGKYDPLLGRSYFEIAMEARSQHKSQEQGVLELRGDQFSLLKLHASDAKETSIFQGLDNDPTAEKFDINDKPGLLRRLVDAYPSSDRKDEITKAIAAATGLRIDALADSETVVADEPFLVGVKAYVTHDSIKVKDIALTAPYRWSVIDEESPKTNSPANILRETTPFARFFRVTAPQNPWFTQPYWLLEPREGDIFRWTGTSDEETIPFQRRPLAAQITVEVLGRDIAFVREVQYRFADDIRGEIRRNVDFVPTVNIEMDQTLILVNASEKPQTKRVTMTITNLSNTAVVGKPSLYLGSDKLNARALTSKFELKRMGEKTSVSWDITIAAKTPPGRYSIIGEASIGNTYFTNRMRTVAYPHIQTHRYYTPNNADFQVIDLKTAPVKIGYITGSGDRVQDAIRQMGFSVETISDSELASGDLSKYDTIVVGIRAYQVRPDVAANNQRLLDFVKSGGTLIVQYQLPQTYAQQNLMPYPAKMTTNVRVADENAPVKILVPDHPIFNFPNKIGENDWKNWVQERNLYSITEFDEKYTPLLESHDEGESESKGGMLVADIGKGKFIYTSYSWFRQLPAGNPGAYRIFSNMVSLPKTKI